jgi:hypothetical protein
VFQVMVVFNTLISLAYGPPALLGLAIRRTPPWSGLASFSVGLVLGLIGAFVYHWSLIQQVIYIIPASFGIFFLSMLFDRGDTPGRARLFKNLNTPVDVAVELKDSPDFTAPVFRFLSVTILIIGLLSLLLLFSAPTEQRTTVLLFSALTLLAGGSLFFVRGNRPASTPVAAQETVAPATANRI